MPFEMYLDYTEEDLLWLTRLYRRTRQKLLLALRILARAVLALVGLYCLKSYFFWLRLEYNAVILLVYAVAVFGFLVYSFFQDRLRARKANKQRKENGGVTTIFFSTFWGSYTFGSSFMLSSYCHFNSFTSNPVFSARKAPKAAGSPCVKQRSGMMIALFLSINR